MKKYLGDFSYIGLSIILGLLIAVFSHKIFLKSDLDQFQRLGDIFCTEIQAYVQVGGYRKATELLEAKFRQKHLKGSTFFLADGNKTYYEGKKATSSHHKIDCQIDGKKGVRVHFLFSSKYLTAKTKLWFLYLGILFSSLLIFFYKRIVSYIEGYVSRIIGFSLLENLGLNDEDMRKTFKSGFIERLIDLNGHIFRKVKSDMALLKLEIEEKSRALAISESEKMRLLTEKKKNEEFIKYVDQVRHDIGGPLSSIKAIRPKHLSSSNLGHKILASIADRMSEILSDLDRIKTEYNNNKTEKVIVEQAIASVMSEKMLLFNQKRNNIGFSLNLREEELFSDIRVDGSVFKRMISNILDNSVEALNDHQGLIHVCLKSLGPNLIIQFVDNGVGIDEEILPKLFKEGATFGKKGGKGLGLYAAKKFIEKNHGKILIRSKKNIGTMIEISLPLNSSTGISNEFLKRYKFATVARKEIIDLITSDLASYESSKFEAISIV